MTNIIPTEEEKYSKNLRRNLKALCIQKGFNYKDYPEIINYTTGKEGIVFVVDNGYRGIYISGYKDLDIKATIKALSLFPNK